MVLHHSMVFSLAHLSDLHLPLRPGAVSLRELTGKQVLALLAWRRKRSRAPQMSGALLNDLAAHAPDHLAVTGDLVNLAAASEFGEARAWLEKLGPPERVSVVPGNHDETAAQPWRTGIGQWEGWMQGDAGAIDGGAIDGGANDGGTGEGDPFPFLRRRGPLAVIGLSTAVPTPIGSAAGRLGAGQLRRLEALLGDTRREDLFRVVLLHHPPVAGRGGPRKALQDRSALCAVLRRCGAELVLHGHHHVTRLAAVPGPDGPVPVCGVPSASAARHEPEPPGWRLYRVTREDGGWRIASHGRQYDPARGGFRPSGSWTLRVPSFAGGHGA